ncbi:MAG: DUF305 domain-containing protein [Gemmatimonadota bacterium]
MKAHGQRVGGGLGALLVLVAVVSGCGQGDPGDAALPAGDPSATAEVTDEAAEQDPHAQHGHDGLPATAGPGYTVDDVRFMQMMIAHHDQALRMARMTSEQGAGLEVSQFSERIDISQQDEIRFMERWLDERDQAIPGEDERHAMRMPGMVSPEDFQRLGEARGPEFDRLFLNLMIEHHVGALEMVDELFASPGAAQDSELFQFATDVGADQMDEIGIMERLIDRLQPA